MIRGSRHIRGMLATRWVRVVVAISLTLLMLNGVIGAVAHVVLVDHVYCETHQEVEHAGDHDVRDSGSTDVLAHTETPIDHEDPTSDDNPCELHMWLNDASVPMPDVHASLLDLPPPAEGLELEATPTEIGTYQPIDILHVSPGLSPPSGLV
ncbi:MAG: hypothetical protein ACQEVA_12070 [Myxococcota bacterium]